MNSTITRIVLVAALIAMPMPALAQYRRAIHSANPPGTRKAIHSANRPGTRPAVHSANRPGTRPAMHVPGPRR